MNKVTSPLQQLANRIVAHALSEDATFTVAAAPAKALQVCEKLRPQLVMLMGDGGFRALLIRALARASVESSRLRNLRVNAEGLFEVKNQDLSPVEQNNLKEHIDILLREFLTLLVNFLGVEITTGIVRNAWPGIQVVEADINPEVTP